MKTLRRGEISLERGRVVQDLSLSRDYPTPAIVMRVIDDSTIFGHAYKYRVAPYNLQTGAIFPQETWRIITRKQIALDRYNVVPEDMLEEGLRIGIPAYRDYLARVGQEIIAWMRRTPEQNWERMREH